MVPRTVQGDRLFGNGVMADFGPAIYVAEKEIVSLQQAKKEIPGRLRVAKDKLVIARAKHLPAINLLSVLEAHCRNEMDKVFENIGEEEDETLRRTAQDAAVDKYNELRTEADRCADERSKREFELDELRSVVEACKTERSSLDKQIRSAEETVEALRMTRNALLLDEHRVPREHRDYVHVSDDEESGSVILAVGRDDIDGARLVIRPNGSKTGLSRFREQISRMEQLDQKYDEEFTAQLKAFQSQEDFAAD